MTVMSILWAIAFGICPQRPSHSLFLGGQQMPIEARMAGMFGGFIIGVGYFVALGRGRAWRTPGMWMSILLVGFLAVMGLDGLNALLFDLRLPHLYPPNLPLRLGTGLLTGLAGAAFLLPAFNSTVWQTGLERSPLASVRDLVIALTLEALYFAAAFSGQSALLYPVSLIAVLGVPLVIGMTGSIVWVSVSGKTNQAGRLTQVIAPAVGGLMLAALLLGLMSAVRFALFGLGSMEMPF